MCHTSHINHTLQAEHAHIISPNYAGSFPVSNKPCYLTLLPLSTYQYTKFTIHSVHFYIQPAANCSENSVQYLKFRIHLHNNGYKTLYFCGVDQLNFTYVATQVDISVKREYQSGLPGFHIIYTG